MGKLKKSDETVCKNLWGEPVSVLEETTEEGKLLFFRIKIENMYLTFFKLDCFSILCL